MEQTKTSVHCFIWGVIPLPMSMHRSNYLGVLSNSKFWKYIETLYKTRVLAILYRNPNNFSK